MLWHSVTCTRVVVADLGAAGPCVLRRWHGECRHQRRSPGNRNHGGSRAQCAVLLRGEDAHGDWGCTGALVALCLLVKKLRDHHAFGCDKNVVAFSMGGRAEAMRFSLHATLRVYLSLFLYLSVCLFVCLMFRDLIP